MTLRIRFEPADGFRSAWADYGLSEAALHQLKRNLSRNPIIGKPSTADPGIRRYKFRQHIVSYALVDRGPGKGEVVVWLLDLTPVGEPPSTLSRWGRDTLRGISWIMRIWRGKLPKDDDGEE